MDTKNIEQYRVFLRSKNYVTSTINGYIRIIEELQEPLTSNDPGALLNYVDTAIYDQKESLSKSNYKVLRASLGAFFYMRTSKYAG